MTTNINWVEDNVDRAVHETERFLADALWRSRHGQFSDSSICVSNRAKFGVDDDLDENQPSFDEAMAAADCDFMDD